MKKFFWLTSLTLVMFLAGGCGGGPTGITKEPVRPVSVRRVSMDEAKTMMAMETGYILLDVRTQKEYEEGHLPGAICIPNETIAETPPSRLTDKNQLIFVYCRSGQRSHAAAQKLAKMGYTNLVDLGGITDWQGELVKGKL